MNWPSDKPLMRIYDEPLSLYVAGDGQPRGRFAIGTATAETVKSLEIRSALAEGLRRLDADPEAPFRPAA